jgi:hypothetical protein
LSGSAECILRFERNSQDGVFFAVQQISRA